MQRTILSGLILGFLLSCCGGASFASEADELRERAKAIQNEASVMAERGNKEQAERLEKESVKLLEAAERLELKAKVRWEKGDRPGIDKEVVQRLKEVHQNLLAKLREANAPEQELAKMREQVAGISRELHMIHTHHAERGEPRPEFRAEAEKLEVASRRIHHLRVAAENLKMAEEHDIAHKLMEKAEVMERGVQEFKKRWAAEMHEAHGGEHGPDVVRELKEEIERLRAEAKELRQKLEKR